MEFLKAMQETMEREMRMEADRVERKSDMKAMQEKKVAN
jgi:hypothetical protein